MSKYNKDTKFYWLQLKEDFFDDDAIQWTIVYVEHPACPKGDLMDDTAGRRFHPHHHRYFRRLRLLLHWCGRFRNGHTPDGSDDPDATAADDLRQEHDDSYAGHDHTLSCSSLSSMSTSSISWKRIHTSIRSYSRT